MLNFGSNEQPEHYGKIRIATKEQAAAVLARVNEIKRGRVELPSFVDPDFPAQAEFINDNSPLGSVLCTRRSGKSYGAGLKLFKKAYDYPGSTVLYLSLTRDSAERIMWRDVLKKIAEKHKIPYHPHNTKLTMTLKNDSVIKLAGADADEQEKEKFLGGSYPYIVIDEAGSFETNLEQLVYEYLEPAVADYDGSIDLIGTPTVFWQGFFCKVTEGKEKGWNIHQWTTFDNPYMVHWQKRIEMLKERNPRIEETPGYQRMYLGKWVKDESDLIYRFKRSENLTETIPTSELAGQILGLDLGFTDATAYSLGRWYFDDPALYVVSAYKRKGQIVDDIVRAIGVFVQEFGVRKIVVDNASKQVVETLKARFQLWELTIEAAQKQDKMVYIEFFNSDLKTGRIKLVKGMTDDLINEWENLIKDPKSQVIREHPSCQNHAADATLYMWREARNYMVNYTREEVSEEDEIEQEIERAYEQQKRRKNPYDRDVDESLHESEPEFRRAYNHD